MHSSLSGDATDRGDAPSIRQWFTFAEAEEYSKGVVTENYLNWIYRNLEEEKYKRFRRAFQKIGKWRRVCLPIFEMCLLEREES